MDDEKYVVPYFDSFTFEMYDAKGNTKMHLHRHDSLELNYVISGSGTNYIEDKKYDMKAGDLFLINNLERHIAVSDGTLQMKIVLFDSNLLWQNTSDNLNLLTPFYSKGTFFSNKINLNKASLKQADTIFSELEQEWQNKECGYKLFIKAKLMELTAILYRYLNREETLSHSLSYQNSYEKIRPSITYINENYEKPLSLELLAELSCMNKSYFSTYFKKVTAMTLWEYIEMIRINHAQLSILTTGKSITEIALECGFGTVSTFNTAFKKITGVTPSSYRKNAGTATERM